MRTDAKQQIQILRTLALLLTTASAVFSQNNPAVDNAVMTNFTILVGFPSGGLGATAGVLLIPGTVIPMIHDEMGMTEAGKSDLLDKSLSFTKAVDKLWSTFRLDPARQIQKGLRAANRVGDSVVLPELEGANVKMTATLIGYNKTSASYRVVFKQGEKTLADSTVIVTRGGHAVVGGTDGEAAPYIFVFVAPEAAGDDRGDALDMKKNPEITAPVLLRKVDPKYPEEARKNKKSGVVVLNVVIDTDGKVEDVKAIESPDDSLTRAAIDSVKQWEFHPAHIKGKLVKVLSTITFRFELR